MVEKEVKNKKSYTEIKKGNIKIVKKNVNKNIKELKKDVLICEKLFKDLKEHTTLTVSARPFLLAHKDPLKIRLVINTQNLPVYKIGSAASSKSFIKDFTGCVDNIKNEKLNINEKFISFDM